MKDNILVVCLDYEFSKKIAYQLSTKLDMFFLDVNDLIEYRIIDKQNMQLVCGMEYFEKEQKKVIMGVSEYENTVINFPYSKILNSEYADYILKTCSLVYVKVTKNQLKCLNNQKSAENKLDTELIAYQELNKLLCKQSSITISLEKLDEHEAVDKIILQTQNM